MYIFVRCTTTPRPTEITFADFFTVTTSEDTVLETTRVRNEMARTLSGNYTHLQKKVAIEKYLPYLFALQASIKTGTVTLKQKILYKWTSFLNEGKHIFENPQINFEVTMALSAYAYTLANCAIATANEFFEMESISSTPLTTEKITENSKECSQYFRKAAGVLQYLTQTVLPAVSPAHGLLPLECATSMMEGMAQVFLAEAQIFAVMLASEQQNNPVTMARLCLGIARQIERAHQQMKLNHADYRTLLPSMPILLDLIPKHFESLALRHLADAEMAKEMKNCGAACCYILQSIKLNEELLPLKTQPEVKKVLQRIHEMNAKSIEDRNYENQHVYFQPVPVYPPSTIPEPANITKAVPFEPPPPLYTTII